MKGKELIFISRIKRDGSGVMRLTEEMESNPHLMDEEFEIKRLNIKEQTFIAHGLSTYVVKKKEHEPQELEKWELEL